MIVRLTMEELIKDFSTRCLKVDDIGLVKYNILNGKCPFLNAGFEENRELKRARVAWFRYRDIILNQSLGIIKEVEQ